MIYIVYKGTDNIEQGTILFKIDAWDDGAYDKAIEYIRTEHWVPTKDFITANGDMVIEVV